MLAAGAERPGAASAPAAEAAALPRAGGRTSERCLSALDMLPIIKFANELESNIYLLAGLGVSQSPSARRPAVAGSPAPRRAFSGEKTGLGKRLAASSYESASGTQRVGDNRLDKDSAHVVTL